MRTIHLVNQSPLVSLQQLVRVARALQVQAHQHFAPIWGIDASVLPVNGNIPQQGETIYLLDNSDQADALGYHQLTQGDVPVGFCFVKTTMDAGDQWTATLSHEFLEMLADPFINQTAIAPWGALPTALALEACDPVENHEYPILGMAMSNFIYPQWFQEGLPNGTKCDYLGKSQPLTLTAGGYQAYTTDLSNWQQTFGDKCPKHQQQPAKYSRRGRRFS